IQRHAGQNPHRFEPMDPVGAVSATGAPVAPSLTATLTAEPKQPARATAKVGKDQPSRSSRASRRFELDGPTRIEPAHATVGAWTTLALENAGAWLVTTNEHRSRHPGIADDQNDHADHGNPAAKEVLGATIRCPT